MKLRIAPPYVDETDCIGCRNLAPEKSLVSLWGLLKGQSVYFAKCAAVSRHLELLRPGAPVQQMSWAGPARRSMDEGGQCPRRNRQVTPEEEAGARA